MPAFSSDTNEFLDGLLRHFGLEDALEVKKVCQRLDHRPRSIIEASCVFTQEIDS